MNLNISTTQNVAQKILPFTATTTPEHKERIAKDNAAADARHAEALAQRESARAKDDAKLARENEARPERIVKGLQRFARKFRDTQKGGQLNGLATEAASILDRWTAAKKRQAELAAMPDPVSVATDAAAKVVRKSIPCLSENEARAFVRNNMALTDAKNAAWTRANDQRRLAGEVHELSQKFWTLAETGALLATGGVDAGLAVDAVAEVGSGWL